MSKRNLAIVIILGLLAWPAAGSATTRDGASKFIGALSANASRALNSGNLSLDQKENQVRALMSEIFDLKLIGRFVLGSAWRKTPAEQRAQYLELFEQFILRTYSRRLGGYTGQKFDVIGAKKLGKKDVLVLTKISRPAGPPIKAGWRVRETKNGHKILDVMVAGVSMVVTQRSEFRSVIRRRGVTGLIETLRLQVSKFSAQK